MDRLSKPAINETHTVSPVQQDIAQKIPYVSIKGTNGEQTKDMASALSEIRDNRPNKQTRGDIRKELGQEEPFSKGVSIENKDVYRRIINNKYSVNIDKDIEEFLIKYDRSFESDKSAIDNKDLNPKTDGSAVKSLEPDLYAKVEMWAKAKMDLSDVFNMSFENSKYQFSDVKDKQRGFSPKVLSEVASDFNTACVVMGDTNFKKRNQRDYMPDYQLFYGQNQGYKLWKNDMNDVLKGKLTKIGFEYWEPKNCAEVDAIQKATNAGIDLEHAHMYTVGASFDKGRYIKIETKPACLNCTAAFGSSVRDRNYSGWDKKTLVEREDFVKMLDIEYLKKSSKNVEDIVEKEAHIDDKNKALNSYDAIHRL